MRFSALSSQNEVAYKEYGYYFKTEDQFNNRDTTDLSANLRSITYYNTANKVLRHELFRHGNTQPPVQTDQYRYLDEMRYNDRFNKEGTLIYSSQDVHLSDFVQYYQSTNYLNGDERSYQRRILEAHDSITRYLDLSISNGDTTRWILGEYHPLPDQVGYYLSNQGFVIEGNKKIILDKTTHHSCPVQTSLMTHCKTVQLEGQDTSYIYISHLIKDEAGRKKKSISYWLGSSGSIEKKETTFEKNLRTVQEFRYQINQWHLQETRFNLYDELNRMIKTFTKSRKGEVSEIWYYEYH